MEHSENGRSGIGRNLKKCLLQLFQNGYVRLELSMCDRINVLYVLFSLSTPAFKNIITPVNFMTQRRGLFGLKKNPSEG